MNRYINCFVNGRIGKSYHYLVRFGDKYLLPVFLLFIRLWMAQIFWYSALAKIGNWQGTIYLFKFEYQVPFIPAELAAILVTTLELIAPISLLFGFLTRIICVPLLVMVAVIQYTYPEHIEHLYWAILLGCILFVGPGKLSLDYVFYEISTNGIFFAPNKQKSELEGVSRDGHVRRDGERGGNDD